MKAGSSLDLLLTKMVNVQSNHGRAGTEMDPENGTWCARGFPEADAMITMMPMFIM